MTHERFSESEAWELENPDEDLRGRAVVGEDGRAMGRVEDMLVDTATLSIDAVLLDTGREIPAASLDISGSELRLVDDVASPLEGLADADPMTGTELEDALRHDR